MKKTARKLTLSRETLHNLANSQLQAMQMSMFYMLPSIFLTAERNGRFRPGERCIPLLLCQGIMW